MEVMKRSFLLIFLSFILSGCYQQSLTMIAPAAGVSQGKAMQSSLTSAFNYAVREQTGKTTLEHIFIREKNKTIKKVASIEKTVIENSQAVKSKILKTSKGIISQKDKIQSPKTIAKNTKAKLKWVLDIKEIKTVSQEEAFPANKPRYSYFSKQK